MRRQERVGRSRGFTLIEMMIASGIAVIILVGGMSAGVALQRRSMQEEQKLKGQDEMRMAKDFFIEEIVRAGTPFGNARIYVGGAAMPYRYGLRVVTNTTPNPFPSGFSAPTGDYAQMQSDYLEILSKATDGQAVYTLASCVGTGPSRVSSEICLSTVPTPDDVSWTGRWVLISNSDRGMGCLAKVTGTGSATNRFAITMGSANADPVSATDPCSINGSLWNAASTTVTLARAVGFRVNWSTGNSPRLEMSQDVLAATPVWATVSRQVEQVKISLGVGNLAIPAAAPVWFGPTAYGTAAPNTTVPIDACTTCTIPGGATAYDTSSAFTQYQQLMRRVRAVDIAIRVRSPASDRDKIQKTGSAYKLDEEGLPLDGFTRRTSVFRASPRNLGIAGDFTSP